MRSAKRCVRPRHSLLARCVCLLSRDELRRRSLQLALSVRRARALVLSASSESEWRLERAVSERPICTVRVGALMRSASVTIQGDCFHCVRRSPVMESAPRHVRCARARFLRARREQPFVPPESNNPNTTGPALSTGLRCARCRVNSALV